MSKLVQHLHDNKGETNVSKMVLVAIVFVVGVVLLVMTTSAFKGPIANWWQARAEDWFADSTGKFAYENDAFWMYERNDNGTYKGVNYRMYFDDGSYIELRQSEIDAWSGAVDADLFYEVFHNGAGSGYEAGVFGSFGYFSGPRELSDDGKTLTADDFFVFVATEPN